MVDPLHFLHKTVTLLEMLRLYLQVILILSFLSLC